MQVHRYSSSLPAFTNAVITIGTFDGVHLGHQQILTQLKHEALHANGESVIITFHPHPRRVVGEQHGDLRLLNSLHEKIELLHESGIDHLVIVAFTEDFARQSAIEYVEDFLVSHFKPHTIIIGYDHRFGRNREGNYQLLEALKEKYGFRVKEISEKLMDNVTISSTKVRMALLNGHVEEANAFLGYHYFIEGMVVPGNKLGRTIGYPTANIRLTDEEKLVPANGVYAVKVSLGDDIATPHHFPENKFYKGMMNIGVRPTVDGTSRTIEVNLFDFDEDIYGKSIRLYFHHRLRGEVKFENLDALKAQLLKDEVSSRGLLAS